MGTEEDTNWHKLQERESKRNGSIKALFLELRIPGGKEGRKSVRNRGDGGQHENKAI